MFQVYEVNTGLYIASFSDERLAWSAANLLNDAHSEAMGLEYSVHAPAQPRPRANKPVHGWSVAGGDND